MHSKAAGGNHFEYSEVQVLQQNDQQYRDGVGPSPKRGEAEPTSPSPSLNPPLTVISSSRKMILFRACRKQRTRLTERTQEIDLMKQVCVLRSTTAGNVTLLAYTAQR